MIIHYELLLYTTIGYPAIYTVYEGNIVCNKLKSGLQRFEYISYSFNINCKALYVWDYDWELSNTKTLNQDLPLGLNDIHNIFVI